MRSIFLLLSLAWLLVSTHAAAQQNDGAVVAADGDGLDSTSDEQGEDSPARKAFEEGKTYFKNKDYINASKKFREANTYRPSWKLLYNIGQSEAAAKRHGLALEAFEAYLSLGGDEIPDERREVVTSELERLRAIVGFIAVEAPVGTVVVIDGFERGKTPLPGPLMVASGISHQVGLTLPNDEEVEKNIKVAGGQTIRVSADISETTSEDAALVSEPQNEGVEHDGAPVGRSKLVPIGWAGVGVGGAVLIAGAVTGIMALAKSDDLDRKCPDRANCSEKELIDSVNGLSTATDILLPVGGVITATGLILVTVGYLKSKKVRETSLLVKPMLSRSLGGFAVEGRF